jgi:hypothetical protein
MKSKVVLLIVLNILLLLYSCDNRTSSILDLAEQIVSQNPDSARSLLRDISVPSLSKSNKMRYDLLVAEIRYMKDDTDTSPGSLAYIGEYYSLRGDNHNAARAYYYEGDVISVH